MPALMLGRDPDGNFREVAVDLDGNLGVAAGAGSATSDLQEDQLAALADILTEVTGAAKDTSVAAVTAAVTALGAGATIAQLLTELGLHGDALDTVVARLDVALSTRASEVTADRAADAAESLDAKTPPLTIDGRVPSDVMTGGGLVATEETLQELLDRHVAAENTMAPIVVSEAVPNAAVPYIQTGVDGLNHPIVEPVGVNRPMPVAGPGGTALARDTSVDGLEAGQATGNASLASLDAGIPNTLGAAGGMRVEGVAGGQPVPVSGSISAAVTGAVTSNDPGLPDTLGKQAPAGSTSVTLATGEVVATTSTQLPAALAAGGGLKIEGVAGGVAVSVSATSLPLPSGAATEASVDQVEGYLDTVETRLGTAVAQASQLPAALAAAGGLKIEGVAGGVSVNVDTELSAAGPLATAAGQAAQAQETTQQSVLTAVDTLETLTTAVRDRLPAALGSQAPSLSLSVVTARDVRRADASSYPAAGTSFLLSATPAGVRRIEWRYTGGGTKYLLLMNSATIPPAITSWTGWYSVMSNGAGRSWFEFPVPVFCSAGVALAVSVTEPVAGTPITLSTAAAENFGVPFYQLS